MVWISNIVWEKGTELQLFGRSLTVFVFGILAACVVVVGFICVSLGQIAIGLLCIVGAAGVFMVALYVNSQTPLNRRKELLKAIGKTHTAMWGTCTVDGSAPMDYELRFGDIAMWVEIPRKIVTVVPYVNVLSSNAASHDDDIKMELAGIGKCVFSHDDPLRIEAVKQWVRSQCIMADNA